MPHFICTTCGTQYAENDQPPAACAICQDERQYVKATGQQWTTMERLRLTNRNSVRHEEAGLLGVGIDPPFAIGQRALCRGWRVVLGPLIATADRPGLARSSRVYYLRA